MYLLCIKNFPRFLQNVVNFYQCVNEVNLKTLFKKSQTFMSAHFKMDDTKFKMYINTSARGALQPQIL